MRHRAPPGRRALPEFERGARPRGLALLGWAGGLRDDLAVGDIVIADRALSAGRSDVNCLAPALPGTARVHRGPVLTADHVVAAPAAKRSAAACGALAVEMEAYPLAAWAAQHAVPFVHGRVILDTVEDALPALDGVLDGYGRLQIRPLLGALRGGRPCWANSLAWRSACAGSTGAWPSWQRLWSRPCSGRKRGRAPATAIAVGAGVAERFGAERFERRHNRRHLHQPDLREPHGRSPRRAGSSPAPHLPPHARPAADTRELRGAAMGRRNTARCTWRSGPNAAAC